MCVASWGSMDQLLCRLVTRSAVAVCVALTVVAACTHTSDRVIEPVGGGDASTTSPEVSDSGVSPIGPIAHPIEPAEDFRLVRSPEFGAPGESAQAVSASALSIGDVSANVVRLGGKGNQLAR